MRLLLVEYTWIYFRDIIVVLLHFRDIIVVLLHFRDIIVVFTLS